MPFSPISVLDRGIISLREGKKNVYMVMTHISPFGSISISGSNEQALYTSCNLADEVKI